MLKRRIKKLTKSMVKQLTGTKILTCKECNIEDVQVSAGISAVTCAYCVQKMIGPPPNYKKAEKSDKPRGWHFKAYFEHEGVVYSKGKVVSDKKEITKLKNSNVEPAPKKTVAKKATKVKSAPVAKKPTVKAKKMVLKTKTGEKPVVKSKPLPKVTKKATKTSSKRGIKNARTTK